MATRGSNATASRRIRLGMVGGGRDAFIGGVHRIASRIDDRYELVAGAFTSTPEKSKAPDADFGVTADRAYGDYVEMAKREARLKNGIEAVSIVTPNHIHYPVARGGLGEIRQLYQAMMCLRAGRQLIRTGCIYRAEMDHHP